MKRPKPFGLRYFMEQAKKLDFVRSLKEEDRYHNSPPYSNRILKGIYLKQKDKDEESD